MKNVDLVFTHYLELKPAFSYSSIDIAALRKIALEKHDGYIIALEHDPQIVSLGNGSLAVLIAMRLA